MPNDMATPCPVMANHLIVPFTSDQELLNNSKSMARLLQTTCLCCLWLCRDLRLAITCTRTGHQPPYPD
jgi:hypothetical protein